MKTKLPVLALGAVASMLLLQSLLPGIAPSPRAAAAPAAPSLAAPAEGATLSNFGPTLNWTNPAGTTQVHVQVIPANNDGPGVNLYFGSPVTSLEIPPPPTWYGLLPGMGYTWKVRASDATTGVDLEDPSWSPFAERKFKTPSVDSSVVTLTGPSNGNFTTSRTPTMTWSSSRADVFYWEVQVSKDRTFETDPAKATAMVYNALLHGGVTNPKNSYAIPSSFPLEEGMVYYWRVRPRVQGDGTPVAWTAASLFRMVAPGFKVAFAADNDLYVANADGSGGRAVVRMEGGEQMPYWAPGGKRLVYSLGGSVQDDVLTTVNADGSGATSLGASGIDPMWSPDGSRIAYVAGNGTEVYVMNADGSGNMALAPMPATLEYGLSWSPDSARLAFHSESQDNRNSDIYVVNADGSGLRNISNTPGLKESYPGWSPDGSRVAFYQGDATVDQSAQLWVMNADGSGKKLLASNTVPYGPPQWSPDAGSRLLFTTVNEGVRQVMVVNADGTGAKQLSPNTQDGADVALWSPDGTRISYITSFDFGPMEVVVANADGSGVVRVAAGKGVPVHGPRQWAVWPQL